MNSLHPAPQEPSVLYRFSHIFDRLATGPITLIFLAAQILFNILVLSRYIVISADGKELPVLDLMFGFSEERAYALLDAYGAEGRRGMLFVTRVVDTIYPIIYTLFNILALTFLAKKLLPQNSKWWCLNLLPLLVLLSDLIENRGIGSMIEAFPERHPSAAHIASLANQFKWGIEAVCILLMLVGLCTWAYRTSRRAS
jgi:hypothetical protein